MESVLYILDANVLIDANRDYYPIERVPEFWDWLAEMGEQGRVKVPVEVYEEVVLPSSSRPDQLIEWLRLHRDVLVLQETVREDLVARVTEEGYADDLTDVELEKIGRDPFLIAYALVNVSDRCIVTTEHSRPSRSRANRHLPDVSQHFNVPCISTFDMIRSLDFRTGWRAGVH